MDDFVRQPAARHKPSAQMRAEDCPINASEKPLMAKARITAWPKFMVPLAAVIVLALAGAWLAWERHADSGVPSELAIAKDDSSFPLFYPEPLPAGDRYVDGSYRVADSVAMFNVKDSQGHVFIVTEQTKPSVMEEVTKTKQFSAPAGSAYIADLNGHSVGFMETGKTLVIISSSEDVTGNQLSPLLTSLKQL